MANNFPGLRFQALLLDLDDTLLDSRSSMGLAMADFHATHGHQMGVGPEEAAVRWLRATDTHYPRYARGEIAFQGQRRCRVRDLFARPDMPDAEADALFQIYLHLADRHYVLFADVLPFLERMKGTPMAIVTNGATDVQLRKVRTTGLEEWTRTVMVSEAVGCRKPQKEIFLMAAEALGADPTACVMVGDNYEADCLGAKAAGMQAVWMNRFNLPIPKSDAMATGRPLVVSTLTELAR